MDLDDGGEESAQAPTSAKGVAAAVAQPSNKVAGWDPLRCPDWDGQEPAPWSRKRIHRDLQTLFQNPPHGIFVVPDENELTRVHALVVGPFDTPYEGGFFYFLLRLPPNYPIGPPRVRLMTTGDDTVRFNPNLYRNGKVCLSILGTWSGPGWAASLSLESVLLSIQSLMSERPYHNEPGFDVERSPGDSERYNDIVRHETVRVAVCDMLSLASHAARQMPVGFRDVIRTSFAQFFEHYKSVCLRLQRLQVPSARPTPPTAVAQGSPMNDPFGETGGRFDPDGLLARLQSLYDTLDTAASPPSTPATPATS